MRIKSFVLLTALLAFSNFPLSRAAEPAQPTATLQGDASRPEAAHWLRSELYFGVGLADDPKSGITEEKWREFLDKEVTTRFPDGLTVFDAYGQWLNRGKEQPGRLRTKVLVILHEDTPEKRAAITAIRLAWKAGTRHQSVLLVTQPAEISF